MEMRVYGRTGMRLSVLGFGCGAVGGLMVRGDPRDQERAVARALELGVNYFDTAAQYGNGRSEENLGRVIKAMKLDDIYVGTKVRLPPTEPGQIGAGITGWCAWSNKCPTSPRWSGAAPGGESITSCMGGFRPFMGSGPTN